VHSDPLARILVGQACLSSAGIAQTDLRQAKPALQEKRRRENRRRLQFAFEQILELLVLSLAEFAGVDRADLAKLR
jgi:hypothetical protein